MFKYFIDLRDYEVCPDWMFRLAKIFGQRVEARHGPTVVVCYVWRGHTYVTEIKAKGLTTDA